jgi:hypothetical protein
MDSLPIPCVVGSIGYILYYRWRDSVRDEASGLDPINLTIRWNEGIVRDEANVIEGWLDLSEEEAYNPGLPELQVPTVCRACGARIPETDFTPSHCGTCGVVLETRQVASSVLMGEENFFTKVRFGRTMYDLEGNEWEWGVFIHDFPKDVTFKKVPGQWFTHKGQMFRTATAKLDVTYVGFKDEEAHILFFRVTSDPERTRLIQIGLGLTPATASLDQVNKARDLSSIREGIKYLLKWREADAHAQVVTDQYRDSKTRGYKGADRVLDDLDGMRRKKKVTSKAKNNWKNIVIVVLVIIAIVWIAYSFGWIGTPTPTPPPNPNPPPLPNGVPG